MYLHGFGPTKMRQIFVVQNFFGGAKEYKNETGKNFSNSCSKLFKYVLNFHSLPRSAKKFCVNVLRVDFVQTKISRIALKICV